MKFELLRVRFLPKELEGGVLYVSEEFEIAAHLCACGCGTKIRTPLGPTEWSVDETESGPTLRPSVGNWQEACQSHYWIERGKIRWAPKWNEEQVAEGRLYDDERRRVYYEELYRKKNWSGERFFRWLKRLWNRIGSP